jgi:hypothetical protein
MRDNLASVHISKDLRDMLKIEAAIRREKLADYIARLLQNHPARRKAKNKPE